VVVDDGGEPLFFILAPQFVFYFYPARGLGSILISALYLLRTVLITSFA
jgi:hypothetical protein